MSVLGNHRNIAVILEFKKTKLEADLEKATDTALDQIKTKEYKMKLENAVQIQFIVMV